MATLDELKSALKEALEARGVLNKLKAQVRAEIFHTLDDADAPRRELTTENLIINELIREYLEHNHYKHTLSVFLTESGQPREPLGRGFVSGEVKLQEEPTARSRPLLYGTLKKHTSTSSSLFARAPSSEHEISRNIAPLGYTQSSTSTAAAATAPPARTLSQTSAYNYQTQTSDLGTEAGLSRRAPAKAPAPSTASYTEPLQESNTDSVAYDYTQPPQQSYIQFSNIRR